MLSQHGDIAVHSFSTSPVLTVPYLVVLFKSNKNVCNPRLQLVAHGADHVRLGNKCHSGSVHCYFKQDRSAKLHFQEAGTWPFYMKTVNCLVNSLSTGFIFSFYILFGSFSYCIIPCRLLCGLYM